MRLYISGPMRGIRHWNFEAFDKVRDRLLEDGHDPISPADHDREVNPDCVKRPGYETGESIDAASYHKLLGWDLAVIADPINPIDGIVLLPGWEDSVGAGHEKYVAEATGKDIFEAVFDGIQYVGFNRLQPPMDDAPIPALAKAPVDHFTSPIRTFGTGANRNAADHKHDYEGFLSMPVIRRYGRYMHEHRHLANGDLRDSDNWQKGIPVDVYVKSLVRHLFDVWELHRGEWAQIEDFDGKMVTMEDALCAVIFNASGLLHETIKERK